jgi:hypothetical protein
MNRKRIFVLVTGLVLVGASFFFAERLRAQEPTREPAAQGGTMMYQNSADLTATAQQVQAQYQQMVKGMQEMNATMQQHLTAMNDAQGSQKIDDMATVLNDLAQRQQMMSGWMMRMEPAMMMSQMMGEFGNGMMGGNWGSMPMQNGGGMGHGMMGGRMMGGSTQQSR